jgi:NAD(P)-dependent dehydrogenase (short-subunit alcohol dehydrogenase family)
MTARGARVAVADINFEAALALAIELPDALALELDLQHQSSIKAAVSCAVSHFGRLDILQSSDHPYDPHTCFAEGLPPATAQVG